MGIVDAVEDPSGTSSFGRQVVTPFMVSLLTIDAAIGFLLWGHPFGSEPSEQPLVLPQPGPIYACARNTHVLPDGAPLFCLPLLLLLLQPRVEGLLVLCSPTAGASVQRLESHSDSLSLTPGQRGCPSGAKKLEVTLQHQSNTKTEVKVFISP